MPKRSGFQSSINEFLAKSNDEILGELTKFQEGLVEITQRDAWQVQIEESNREETFELRWNRARAIVLKSK